MDNPQVVATAWRILMHSFTSWDNRALLTPPDSYYDEDIERESYDESLDEPLDEREVETCR